MHDDERLPPPTLEELEALLKRDDLEVRALPNGELIAVVTLPPAHLP
jgi:hypothetical protein